METNKIYICYYAVHRSTFANKQAHIHTPLHTQLLCPAIVLQRKHVSGGGGRILSLAEGELRARGADREKTPGWREEAEEEAKEEQEEEKEEEVKCCFQKNSDLC